MIEEVKNSLKDDLFYKIGAMAFGTLISYLAIKMDTKVETMASDIATMKAEIIFLNKQLIQP